MSNIILHKPMMQMIRRKNLQHFGCVCHI